MDDHQVAPGRPEPPRSKPKDDAAEPRESAGSSKATQMLLSARMRYLNAKLAAGALLFVLTCAALLTARCFVVDFLATYDARIASVPAGLQEHPGVWLAALAVPLLPASLSSIVGLIGLITTARYFTNLSRRPPTEPEETSPQDGVGELVDALWDVVRRRDRD